MANQVGCTFGCGSMRGQAHTLEAFTAALLLIGGLTFALQATAVTPLSASTSNQHIQNQQQLIANDLLAATAENDTLQRAVLEWNTTESSFVGTNRLGYFPENGPPNEFGNQLNETFRNDRIAFNVLVYFQDGDGGFQRQKLVFMGSPSDNAVVASRTVTVFNDTRLTGPQSIKLSETVADDEFYAPDAHPGGQLYNVMEVRIVVWRM